MKLRYIFTIAAAAALLSTSCNIMQSKTRSSSASGTTSVEAPANSSRPLTALPQPPKIAGDRPDAATLTGGRWVIAAVDDQQIFAEDEAPYIDFEAGSGRFYGSDGCNIINGDYLLRTDGAMVFSHVISTMRYCPEDAYGVLIARYLSDNSRLYVDTKRIGQDTYLYLRTASDKVVMTLRRHNMEFLNGNWLVTSIDGRPIDDEECNIFFDIAEKKVHGNTGCNYFNGNIYIDPSRSNALDLSNMGTTRMACPKSNQEMAMLVALESTASAIAGNGDNTVLLLDANGHEVMTLRRISTPAQND